jgi:hypothetical protein
MTLKPPPEQDAVVFFCFSSARDSESIRCSTLVDLALIAPSVHPSQSSYACISLNG